ncbi:hypothetical protein [Paludisphaera soli]|uniref:hypothetical protein n=1 Tax=Paludisphaera soli TaxID=2712865 RepID=UPI0013EB8D6B|nr:hypothetical protein [Paludisphaera soli]
MTSGLFVLTVVHVAISLAAIASGFVVLFGLIAGKRRDGWTAFFLATTVATSITGFFFPITRLTPGLVLGAISLVVLAVAVYARYARRLAGAWRPVYVVASMTALYFNVLVLIVQSFQKAPALRALAPTQSEPPFLVAQLATLAAFLVLGALAVRRFPAQPSTA